MPGHWLPLWKVITTVLDDVTALLLDFDCDASCFAYVQDEGKVYTTPRGMRSLQTGVNVLDTKHMSACYLRRLEKHSGH